MRSKRSILLCLFGLAALVSLTHARGVSAAPVFSDCQIGGADSSVHLQARCTSLTVPENRAHPEGRKINLHIAVLKARASEAKTDPLFFIAGGPGQASTEAFVQEAGAFDTLRDSRDIVLVDQRGTGGSNRLDCPAPPAGADVYSDAEIAKAAADCLKALKGDPRFYTTSVAVEDLDAVRAYLGYPTVNLYGISYGTRVALQYLREFPGNTRSVVLDGVVPADLTLGPGVSLDAERALKLIFTRCGQDAACRQAFPDPAGDFLRLETDLKAHPAAVTLRDPLTGEPRSETLSWDKLAGAVRLMSYQSETASLLPLLVHQAAQRDYAPLMGTALMFTGEIESGFAEGMGSAVVCTEDAPFYTDDPATQAALRDTYLGAMNVELMVKSCREWPKGVIAPDFKQPVKSGRPVLLLSGEDDPVTPPANAARAAKTLSNSLSLVVPGQGHGNVFRGCVPWIVADFVETASVKGLNTACVKKIKPFPFFINFSGPTP
ncbi:MAG: alpha/beta hydrolase [Bacillota bacterium]